MKLQQHLFSRLEANSRCYKLLCALTVMGFPLVLVLVVENTHLQSLSALLHFMAGSLGIFLYDILFLSAIFIGLMLLLRRIWLAMLVEGAVFYTLSLVEYFKFDANGTHFGIADLVMAGKISDVARFAKLDVRFIMVANLLLLVFYVLWAAFLNIRVSLPVVKALPVGAGTLALLVAALAIPSVSGAFYQVFGIQCQTSYSPYSADENFQSNLQIAYLSQNISAEFATTLQKPKGYSKQEIETLLPVAQPENGAFQQPDIVMIMSEAYTDFRRFDGLQIPKETYANADRIAREGYRGSAIVPTFGGYTCKTEFELLFGLPVKGIGGKNLPHQLFTNGKPRPTFPAYLKEQGYTTNFLHPFSPSFYSRDKAYRSYGFDRLIFEDDFTVPKTRLGEYIDDHTLVQQIQAQLERGSGAKFVFAVSMQNHGPYSSVDPQYALRDSRLSPNEQAELGRYLYGISQTDQALDELTSYLKTRQKPTVLLFVGDHYPYLGKQGGAMYKKLTNNTNGYGLYQQSYLLWSNYQQNYTLPEQISAFYLPHVVADYINLPRDAYMTEMHAMMQTTPLFTFDLGDNSPDANTLMQLTYDRTEGDDYSAD